MKFKCAIRIGFNVRKMKLKASTKLSTGSIDLKFEYLAVHYNFVGLAISLYVYYINVHIQLFVRSLIDMHNPEFSFNYLYKYICICYCSGIHERLTIL